VAIVILPSSVGHFVSPDRALPPALSVVFESLAL
jgi:hypothetical protein